MSGASIGSVVGFAVGSLWGPFGQQVGAFIGSQIGGYLAPQHIKGPSIGDAQAQTSAAGVPRPVVFAHPAPFAGNHVDGDEIARKIIKKKRQGKGGGPVVEEEHFILTYAIRVSERIGGYLRIWRQGKVVYDARPLNAIPGWDGDKADEIAEYFSEMQAANAKFLSKARLYIGDEAQLPDPALEAIHGVGNTPYYRGSAMLIVEDDDVTDCGGAVPGYMFEVVSCAVATAQALGVFAALGMTSYRCTDPDEWTEDETGIPASGIYRAANLGMNVGAVDGDQNFCYSDDGASTFTPTAYGAPVGFPVLHMGAGDDRYVAVAYKAATDETKTIISLDRGRTWAEAGNLGSIGSPNGIRFFNRNWVLVTSTGLYSSPNGVTFTNRIVGAFVSIGENGQSFLACRDGGGTGPTRYSYPHSANGISWTTNAATTAGPAHTIVGESGYFILATTAGIYRTTDDSATNSLVASNGQTLASGAAGNGCVVLGAGGGGSGIQYGSDDAGLSFDPIDFNLADQEVLFLGYAAADGIAIPDAPGAYIDEITGQVFVTEPADTLAFCADLTLQEVEETIAARAGVPAGKFDASALSEILIPGYLIGVQSTGADCLIPLCTTFFHDLPEFDGKIQAVLRGGAPSLTIEDDDLLEDDADPLIEPQGLEFPLKVTVFTQHPEADYAAIPQTSARTSPDVRATGEYVVRLPIPFDADTTAQIAAKIHNVLQSAAEWREEISLPDEYSRLIVSDVLFRNSRRWLVTRADMSEGESKLEIVYDRASNYSSNATGVAPAPGTPPGSGLIGPTLLEAMNLPILADSHDLLGFYVAVAGMLSGWHGALIQGTISAGAVWTDLATITDASVIGKLQTSLAAAPGEVIDYVNTVRVSVTDELESITFAELLSERNACLIGEELMQFQTATLIEEGVYELSVLTRGRLNTQAVAHSYGERFVLLNAPEFIEAPSSWIGADILLRAVSLGTAEDANASESFEWSPALIQTEWAPFHFEGERDGSDNVAFSWIGRARLGTNLAPIHSVNFLGYRVTITKGASSVVKSLTFEQSFAYSAAEQTIDFGGATGTLAISIEAMNRFTGASAALTGTIL